jgi:MYXO-CTERM domain-containing protein
MRTRAALLASACLTFVTTTAQAHFRLQDPPADNAQNAQGDPQKDAPCGGGTTPTGAVSVFQQGSMISITIDETIFHPGHYRVAIAQTPDELPPEPPVTPGDSECGSAPIDPAPELPVLADGVLVHDAPFNGEQTFQVQLPAGFTCDSCTLQILEFMSSHGAPCYYHHCATVTIQSDPVGTTAAATTGSSTTVTSGNGNGASVGNGATTGSGAGDGGAGGGDGVTDGDDDGCGCRTIGSPDAGTSPWLAALALGALGLGVGRRRRR